MSRLSACLLEFAALLLGDGRADVTITPDGRAHLLPLLRDMADRACKMELDLAYLEALAAEHDPHAAALAAADAVLTETDAELAAREASERGARRLPPGGLRALRPDDPVLAALRDAPPGEVQPTDDALIEAIMRGIDDGKVVMMASLRPRAAFSDGREADLPGGAA